MPETIPDNRGEGVIVKLAGLVARVMSFTAHDGYARGEYRNAPDNNAYRIRLLISGDIEVTWFGAVYRITGSDLVRVLQAAHLDRLRQQSIEPK